MITASFAARAATREVLGGAQTPSQGVVVSACAEWGALDWWYVDGVLSQRNDSVAYVIGPDFVDIDEGELAAWSTFKIGKTARPRLKTRLQHIQTGCPRRLEVKAVVAGGHYMESLLKQVATIVEHANGHKVAHGGSGEWFVGCSAETFLEITELDDLDLCRDTYGRPEASHV